MCGRYRLSRADKYAMEQFGVEVDPDFTPRYNIAPTQFVPVVRLDSDTAERILCQQKWGLIPFWAKDASIGARMINARSETVMEKPAFRDALRKRRCLVPEDGFYEWKTEGTAKQPYCFALEDESAFAFAGIWDQWRSPDGLQVESCSILTTSPNELVGDVHDRMPVILSREQHKLWLETEPERANQLLDLLVAFDAGKMKKYPVSKMVNNARNNSPECAVAMSAAG